MGALSRLIFVFVFYKNLEADGSVRMVLLTKPGTNDLQNQAFWQLTPVLRTQFRNSRHKHSDIAQKRFKYLKK